MIDISYGSRILNDTYLLYKKQENVNEIIPEEQPILRFRAFDYVNQTDNSRVEVMEYRDVQTLTIKALINNPSVDIRADDFVFDVKSKIMWRITGITIDDDNQMKELSLRPRKWLILNLTK